MESVRKCISEKFPAAIEFEFLLKLKCEVILILYFECLLPFLLISQIFCSSLHYILISFSCSITSID